MSIDDWNIEGIADKVIEEMRAGEACIDEVDDYVHRIAYLTVYSRVPNDAASVAASVKKKVDEKYE
jgi:hypothetical protein